MLRPFINIGVFTLLFTFLSPAFSTPLSSVRIASPTDDIESLGELIQFGDCTKGPDKLDVVFRRNAIELLMLCRALKKASPELEIKLIPAANYLRSLQIVKEGKADIVAESIWLEDADESVFHVSAAVLKEGRFEKGVYTRIDHPMRFNVELSENDFRLNQYRGVVPRNWAYDWALLNVLTPKVLSAFDTAAAHKIINLGRADFTLSEFPSNNELSVECEGEVLYPVEGVKVKMSGSRHFVVSRNVPKSEAILTLLNAGVEEMHKHGDIDQLYQHIGFLNSRTETWTVLNDIDVSGT